MIFKKVLQNYHILRHVSAVVITIIRQRPQKAPSWNERYYKAQFVLLCIRNRLHFKVPINLELGQHRVCGGVESDKSTGN